MNKLLNKSMQPSPWDSAGKAASSTSREGESDHRDHRIRSGLYRTAFAIDAADVALNGHQARRANRSREIAQGPRLGVARRREGSRASAGATVALAQDDFSLFQLPPEAALSP